MRVTWLAKQALRRLARGCWWPVRRLTAPLRRLPDTLIIGAQKAGTTTLHHWLAQHPEVAPAWQKQMNYYNWHPDRGLGWYRAHFPLASRAPPFERAGGSGRVVVDATPSYLFYPTIPRLVARDLPRAKLIVLLRDPVERAWSQWRMNRRDGLEPLAFDEALEREPERLARGEPRVLAGAGKSATAEYWLHSYAARGGYAEQLERWFAHFPRERFLILESEAMRADPAATLAEVCGFLGLSPWRPAAFESRNIGRESERPSAAAIERLRAHFGPLDERLAALLGRRLAWMPRAPAKIQGVGAVGHR